jgi:hypothetical protein
MPPSEKEHFVQHDAAPEPKLVIEPQPVQPTDASVAESLSPLILPDPSPGPPNTGPDATQDQREQPRTPAAPVNNRPESAHSASRTLDDPDNLFFALLGKEKPGSRRPEERPLSETAP